MVALSCPLIQQGGEELHLQHLVLAALSSPLQRECDATPEQVQRPPSQVHLQEPLHD